MRRFAVLILAMPAFFMMSGCDRSSSSQNSGGSGGGNGGPTAAIAAPPSVDERSSATLSASASRAGTGTIATYAWTIDAPAGLQVSLNNANAAEAQLRVGEIAENTSVTVRLTVTNSAGQSSSASQLVQLRELDVAALPPAPTADAATATLLGVDTDGDGVRDDVERSILALYPLDFARRQVMLIGARARQLEIVAGQSGQAADGAAASAQSDRFAACAVRLDSAATGEFEGSITVLTVDTPAREQAFFRFLESRNGTVSSALASEGLNCQFN